MTTELEDRMAQALENLLSNVFTHRFTDRYSDRAQIERLLEAYNKKREGQ